MKDQKILETKALMQRAYAMLPTDFSLREVRFYLNQAINRIQLFENKQVKKQEQTRLQEELDAKKKAMQVTYLPGSYDVSKAISEIDRMIAEEERKINVQKQQQQPKRTDDDEDVSQALYG